MRGLRMAVLEPQQDLYRCLKIKVNVSGRQHRSCRSAGLEMLGRKQQSKDRGNRKLHQKRARKRRGPPLLAMHQLKLGLPTHYQR